MAWRTASHLEASPSARPTTATAESCPMYAGTSGSTHGDRKLSSPAPSATAIVRSISDRIRGRGAGVAALPDARVAQHLVQQPSHLADRHEELDPLVAELDDGDPLEVAPVELGVVLDVALDDGRAPPARARADPRSRARSPRAPPRTASIPGARTGSDRGGEARPASYIGVGSRPRHVVGRNVRAES